VLKTFKYPDFLFCLKRGKMVIQEHYVTRKPLEFTIIVLFILFLLLLPVYFYSKHSRAQSKAGIILLEDTYGEVAYIFSPESDISEADKRHLFTLNYEGKFVQWSGTLMACDTLDGAYRVSVDENQDNYAEVLFLTYKDCTQIPSGSDITFKTKLIDWKTKTFTGSEGEILKWE
jgi:hypothetical protein